VPDVGAFLMRRRAGYPWKGNPRETLAMNGKRIAGAHAMSSAAAFLLLSLFVAPTQIPQHGAELVFPLHPEHNHAPAIVECQNGDLLVSWYRGSGERSADDVAVWGGTFDQRI